MGTVTYAWGNVSLDGGGPDDYVPAGCHQVVPPGAFAGPQYPGGHLEWTQQGTSALPFNLYVEDGFDVDANKIGGRYPPPQEPNAVDWRYIISISNPTSAPITLTRYPRSAGKPLTIQPGECYFFYPDDTTANLWGGLLDDEKVGLIVILGVPSPGVAFYGIRG